LYYYQLSVSDPTGNTATSSNLSFTTNPNQTIGEPAISTAGSGPIVGLFGKVYTASMPRVSSAQTGCVSVFNNCVVNDSSLKATTSVFTRNLTIRDTGDDVKKLQQFLIDQGFLGIGNNTGYFGPLTQQAVVQYQKSVGIVPALGFFRPLTRYTVGITNDTFPVQPSGGISASMFTKDLTVGSIDPQVKLLQQYLNSKGFIVSTRGAGSPGAETMYFGKSTQTALIKFQEMSGIKPASGYFGQKTREYIRLYR
jgi:peptidoglycan hydrolase-like protein with peptidoglycan-binding domain